MTYHTTRTILYRYSIYFVVDGQGMPSYHGFVDSERHNIIPRNVPTKNSTALPTATIRQPSCDGTSRRYQIFCRRYRRLIAMPKLPLGRWYNNNKLLSTKHPYTRLPRAGIFSTSFPSPPPTIVKILIILHRSAVENASYRKCCPLQQRFSTIR